MRLRDSRGSIFAPSIARNVIVAAHVPLTQGRKPRALAKDRIFATMNVLAAARTRPRFGVAADANIS
jgi:hypothetical protein